MVYVLYVLKKMSSENVCEISVSFCRDVKVFCEKDNADVKFLKNTRNYFHIH